MSIFSVTPRGYHGDFDNKNGGSYQKVSKRDRIESRDVGPGSYDPVGTARGAGAGRGGLFVYQSPQRISKAVIERRIKESSRKREISNRTGYLTHIMAPNGNIVYAGCSDAASFRGGAGDGGGSGAGGAHEDLFRGPGSYNVAGTMVHRSFNLRVNAPEQFYGPRRQPHPQRPLDQQRERGRQQAWGRAAADDDDFDHDDYMYSDEEDGVDRLGTGSRGDYASGGGGGGVRGGGSGSGRRRNRGPGRGKAEQSRRQGRSSGGGDGGGERWRKGGGAGYGSHAGSVGSGSSAGRRSRNRQPRGGDFYDSPVPAGPYSSAPAARGAAAEQRPRSRYSSSFRDWVE